MCASGYYTNTLFHRVISNFVIQGGGVGPTTRPNPRRSRSRTKPAMGSRICAAPSVWRAPAARTRAIASSIINVADNADLDPLPTRWGYAVFGSVIEGMEVVDRISVSPTGAMGPFKQDAPLQAVVIQKIELLTDAGAPLPRRATPAAAPAPAAGASRPPVKPTSAPRPAGADAPTAGAPPPK